MLEAELDQLRKQLQGTTDQLEHYQALAEKQVCATEICRTNFRILQHEHSVAWVPCSIIAEELGTIGPA